MVHLPATPRPSGAGITDDPKTWGNPSSWPSRITCLSVPEPKGPHRGACLLTVTACDPGAYIRRLSCGVLNNDNKAAPIWQPWGRIPTNGSGPVFFAPNWPGIDWLWDGTVALFAEYAAPDSVFALGGLDLAFDYEH